jgi:hypothetical protein
MGNSSWEIPKITRILRGGGSKFLFLEIRWKAYNIGIVILTVGVDTPNAAASL